MEKWAREEMIKHNACMYAAYTLVMQANGYCENSESNRIAELLENYEVNIETGDMKPPTGEE